MKLSELLAYQGRNNPDGKFTDTHGGDNSHTFGAYKSTRYGTFFSDNPEFSKLYGEVRAYDIDDSNIASYLVLDTLASQAANELDYHDPDQRELASAIGYIAGASNGDEWELFEDQLGEYFVPWLIKQGYDGAQFIEYHDGPDGELRSLTTVVFYSKLFKPRPMNESSTNVIYPMATGNDVHEMPDDGLVLMWMTPDKFLELAPSMGRDYETDEYIKVLADRIIDQLPLDALELGEMDGRNGGHDGRHRAYAAKLAGVEKIPVYVSPDMVDVFDEDLGWNDDLTESFFADNMDILMPIVNGLMQTAARPLIYKLWKKSPNAVLALAAIKKLKDEGDDNPIATIMHLSNLDVPMQFMKRLAYDTGIFDISGVRRNHKPPVGNDIIHEGDDDITNVYHITPSDRLSSIMKRGLIPQIGNNSKTIGETDKAIHVFSDIDSAGDALGNWDMPEWADGNMSLLKLSVPMDWLEPDPSYPDSIYIINQPVKPNMITIMDDNF